MIFAPRHPYVIRKQPLAYEFQDPTLNKILLASLIIMAEELFKIKSLLYLVNEFA